MSLHLTKKKRKDYYKFKNKMNIIFIFIKIINDIKNKIKNNMN